MIVVMNRIPVKPEFAQRIEDGFAKNAPGLTELKGFQGFRLLRPLKDGDPYVVYVSWDSEEDYQAYMGSEYEIANEVVAP